MSGQVGGQVQGFGATLKALMRERRVSVDRLAFATGISPRMITRYRSGVVVPRDPFGDPSDNAYKLASALSVDVGVLFANEPGREAAA